MTRYLQISKALPRVFRVVDDFGGIVFGSIVFIVGGRPFLFVRVNVEISSCVVFADVDNVSVILKTRICIQLILFISYMISFDTERKREDTLLRR